MGCINSTEQKLKLRSKTIDEQQEEDLEKSSKDVKLLLLGTHESGKSTIAKQMKIIYGNGYNDEERTQFINMIFYNASQLLTAILGGMYTLNINFANETSRGDVNLFVNLRMKCEEGELPADLPAVMCRLWADPNVREYYDRTPLYRLNDSEAYYLNNLDRIAQPNYIPSEDDILHTRIKTTGIVETHFTSKDLNFNVVDVGGFRNQRRKWINCSDNVTAVIVCVALSEYDMVLAEDDATNRMQESLIIFDCICNRWFPDTPIFLFLNKKDLFEGKITRYRLTKCFPEYTGGNNYDYASAFIEQQFWNMTNRRDGAHHEIRTHFTCATHGDNVQFAFDAVTDIIKNNLPA